MTSAGWPAVAANAAAKAIVARTPSAPSYWLPTTTGDVAREAQIEDPARLREPGARGLDAHHADRALLERAVDVREADAALVARQRHGPALGEPQAPGPVLDRDRLLDRPHPELGQGITGPHGVVIAPAAVGVDVQVGVRQGVADRAHGLDVQRRGAPDLDLEGVDPEALVHLDGVGGHLGRLGEARPCARRRRRPRSRRAACGTERRGSGPPDPRRRGRPRRGPRSCRPRRRSARRSARARSGSSPVKASLRRPPTASTIDVCVSP